MGADLMMSISAALIAFVWWWHFGIAALVFITFVVFLTSVDLIYFKLEKIEKVLQNENTQHP